MENEVVSQLISCVRKKKQMLKTKQEKDKWRENKMKTRTQILTEDFDENQSKIKKKIKKN